MRTVYKKEKSRKGREQKVNPKTSSGPTDAIIWVGTLARGRPTNQTAGLRSRPRHPQLAFSFFFLVRL